MPTGSAQEWKTLYSRALKANAKCQEAIDQARQAMLRRSIVLADSEKHKTERADLEEALRELWKIEHDHGTKAKRLPANKSAPRKRRRH